MEVLSSSNIGTYILPWLSIGSGGKTDDVPTLAIVQAILYRVKIGYQWRSLPVKEFFTTTSYTWQGVYYHFRQWITGGSWQAVFLALLRSHPRIVDMSSLQMDASHTPAKRGGEAVGYQRRKGCKTTNMTVLSDNNGTPVAYATPKSGNHHDTFEIEEVFREMIALLLEADIDVEGIFLNADAAFDTTLVRSVCAEFGIEGNIPINPRNRTTSDPEE